MTRDDKKRRHGWRTSGGPGDLWLGQGNRSNRSIPQASLQRNPEGRWGQHLGISSPPLSQGCNLIKDQDALEGEVEQAYARDEIYYSEKLLRDQGVAVLWNNKHVEHNKAPQYYRCHLQEPIQTSSSTVTVHWSEDPVDSLIFWWKCPHNNWKTLMAMSADSHGIRTTDTVCNYYKLQKDPKLY